MLDVPSMQGLACVCMCQAFFEIAHDGSVAKVTGVREENVASFDRRVREVPQRGCHSELDEFQATLLRQFEGESCGCQ